MATLSNSIESHRVILMNEDKTLSIEVWFLGYTIEAVQKYITEKYASSLRWTKFKFAD